MKNTVQNFIFLKPISTSISKIQNQQKSQEQNSYQSNFLLEIMQILQQFCSSLHHLFYMGTYSGLIGRKIKTISFHQHRMDLPTITILTSNVDQRKKQLSYSIKEV